MDACWQVFAGIANRVLSERLVTWGILMNRHERRKATKFSEIKWVKLSDITHVRCAWDGCSNACKMTGPGEKMPDGWVALLVTTRGFTNLLEIPARDCLRDSVLCPEHARQLDSLLIDLGREINEPAAGNA